MYDAIWWKVVSTSHQHQVRMLKSLQTNSNLYLVINYFLFFIVSSQGKKWNQIYRAYGVLELCISIQWKYFFSGKLYCQMWKMVSYNDFIRPWLVLDLTWCPLDTHVQTEELMICDLKRTNDHLMPGKRDIIKLQVD